MPQYTDIHNKFINEKFDNVSVAYPDSITEVYSFKLGNKVVATVTLTYTDSTKDNLSSAEKS